VVLAAARISLDTLQDVKVFFEGHRLLDECARTIEKGLPARIVEHHEKNSGPLQALCEEHRKSTYLACKDLLLLTWVQNKSLPAEQRAWLRSARWRMSLVSRTAVKFLASHEMGDIDKAAMTAAIISLLREVANAELVQLIGACKAKSCARETAVEEAGNRGPDLRRIAELRALEDVAEEASKRMRGFDAAKRVSLRHVQGQLPSCPPLWLRLDYRTSISAVSRATSVWTESGRALCDPQESEVTVTAWGQVEIRWLAEKRDFTAADAVIIFSTHQVCQPPLPDEKINEDEKILEAQNNLSRPNSARSVEAQATSNTSTRHMAPKYKDAGCSVLPGLILSHRTFAAAVANARTSLSGLYHQSSK